jgi:hypothetical protein
MITNTVCKAGNCNTPNDICNLNPDCIELKNIWCMEYSCYGFNSYTCLKKCIYNCLFDKCSVLNENFWKSSNDCLHFKEGRCINKNRFTNCS